MFEPPERLRRLQIEITTGCNLECVGCQRTIGMKDRSWRNTHMKLDRFAKVLANAPPADALILQGIGEPTLHPGLPAMIDLARDSGKFGAISFNTNALVRKTDYYAKLRARGLGHISISVDSLEPETAEALRAGTDCARLERAIAELSPLFGGNITLSIVLSRRNAPELPALLKRLHQLGGRVIEIQPLIAYASEINAMALSPAELAAVRVTVEQVKRAAPGLAVILAPAVTPNGSRCSRPFHAGYVTVGGYLTPCCTTNDIDLFGRTSLIEQGFADAWRGPGVQTWLEAFVAREPEICGGCAFNPAGVAMPQAEPAPQPVAPQPPITLAGAKALQAAGAAAAAEAQFRALLDAADAAEALQGLGLARFQQGDAAGAVDLLRAALALKPEPRTAYNTALALAGSGRQAEAAALLEPLLTSAPDYWPPYQALGSLLADRGDLAAAGQVALTLLRRVAAAGAAEAVNQAVTRILELGIDPPDLIDLANRLRIRGLSDPARRLLEARLARAPDDLGARLVLAMCRLTIVHDSETEIDQRRAAYAQDLQSLAERAEAASPDQLSAGVRAVGDSKPFYLSYHGQNDRPLQQAYGAVITRMMAAATGTPGPSPGAPAAGGRLRVGFATGYFHLHSVSKLFGGWIRHLDRGRFEVFGYDLGAGGDDCARSLAAACDHFASGFRHHQHAFETLQADALDVLIYPEIGMHPLAVQLACRRLAPVQCVAWGHPVTTGLPHIDYFLTSDLMEPADGQDAYTEKLVRLPNLSICYDPLPSEGGRLTRADLGLREDAVVYVCCQALYKYLPRHDAVIAAIAAQVPGAQFLFIGDQREGSAARLHARLSAALRAAGVDPADRLVFTGFVPAEAFPSLLRAGDVYLDSIGWSGGNTTLEAATCDLPIVTTPTELMRGRHSAAILTMMGLAEAVSPDLDAYIARAVRLADPVDRTTARLEIAQNKPRLFGDTAPIRALEDFLTQAVATASAPSTAPQLQSVRA